MADTSTTPLLDEIIAGDALGLGAAARLLPAHRGSGRANPTTVWRWITSGARASDGRAVRLEAARVGGRWLTSRGALTRFIRALSTVPDSNEAIPPISKTDSARRGEKAAAALKAMGA